MLNRDQYHESIFNSASNADLKAARFMFVTWYNADFSHLSDSKPCLYCGSLFINSDKHRLA